MPFPKTFVEELIVEWLHLDGFLAEVNLPVGVTKPGGRLEADVVGARIWKDKLEIRHIETGTLSQGVQGANSIASKKFSAYVSRSISKYFEQKFSFKGKGGVKYEKIYVPTYSSTPTVRELQSLGIEVIKLPDLIREKVAETIQEWKRNPPHHPQITGKNVTLPESYWLLQMLDYLKSHNMLKLKKINKLDSTQQQVITRVQS